MDSKVGLPLSLPPKVKVYSFHNIFFSNGYMKSFIKKKMQRATPHHLCRSPVVEHFNQLFLCFKDFSFDLQLVGVELQ